MSFVDRILTCKTLSITGMAKNTGKTVTLNYLLEQLRLRGKAVAVTSIGIDGEKTDKYGRPAVSVLVKNHDGAAYVLAVNASSKKVRARIFASVPDGEGTVLWESRSIAVANGSFEDEFKGFGVHVYRLPFRTGSN